MDKNDSIFEAGTFKLESGLELHKARVAYRAWRIHGARSKTTQTLYTVSLHRLSTQTLYTDICRQATPEPGGRPAICLCAVCARCVRLQ